MDSSLSVETIVASTGGAGVVVWGLIKFIVLDKLEEFKNMKDDVTKLKEDAVTDGELTKTVERLETTIKEGFREVKEDIKTITLRIDNTLERRGQTR